MKQWKYAPRRAVMVVVLGGLCATALPGCVALLMGGAVVGTGMVITDRRTAGTQLEDQNIELKASSRARELLAGTDAHVNTTSYNRTLLLTGEVASETDRRNLEQVASKIENVHATVNELAVMGASTIGSRSKDSLLTSKVKATLVDAKDVQATAFKVVTERGAVYLMGRVTEREANRAAELVRTIPGVLKVVKVLDVVSEAELAKP